MSATIQIIGLDKALRAFNQFPRGIRNKHLRMALAAAGGTIRDAAVPLVRRDSGALAKSLIVKVPKPSQSGNASEPMSAVVGPRRGSGKILRRTSSGTLRAFGAANRALKGARKRLGRERSAVKEVLRSFGGSEYRNPSRYAHLIEKGHGGKRPAPAYPFLGPAARSAGQAAGERAMGKLIQGVQEESARVYAGA